MSQVNTLLGEDVGAHGTLEIQAVLTTEAYTSGTGLSIDCAPLTYREWREVAFARGQSLGGHSLYVTKGATGKTLTVRLFNGTTETSTGNVSTTLQIQVVTHPIRV